MNSNERKWNAHGQAWLKSGLSQKRYCDELNLASSTFRWWRKRLRDAAGTGTDLIELSRKVTLPDHQSAVDTGAEAAGETSVCLASDGGSSSGD